MADEPGKGAGGDVPADEDTQIRPAGTASGGENINQGATGDVAADEVTEIRPAGDAASAGENINQGATGDVPVDEAGASPPTGDAAPAGRGDAVAARRAPGPREGQAGSSADAGSGSSPGPASSEPSPSSGAHFTAGGSSPVGARRQGETPLSVDTKGGAFDERPELFVAGAFLGGVVLAQLLKLLRS